MARYFRAKNEILRTGVDPNVVAGGKRPVIAHLVGAAGAAGCSSCAAIQVVTAPAIIGLPGGVARLENDVMGVGVVPDDKNDVVFAGYRVLAHQVGNVHSGDGGGGHRPGGGNAPVPGIDQADRVIRERRGLDRGARLWDSEVIRRAPLPW